MKILIQPDTLRADGERLRPGALYGLMRLQEMQYEPVCNTKELTRAQLDQLQQEGIPLPEPGKKPPGTVIVLDTDQSGLTLLSEGERVTSAGSWPELVRSFLFPRREIEKKRSTSETDIRLAINLDGTGVSQINTGLKFFDHMLDQIAKHGLTDLEISCSGDLEVDEHHTIEDVAIVLGKALYELCGKDKTGIQRYGFLLAMDESQANVAIDLSNRPYLTWSVTFDREYVGDFPLEMAEHFFHTLAMNLRATIQIEANGKNEHHKIEAIFKGFARALRFAVTRSERAVGLLPSSKGAL